MLITLTIKQESVSGGVLRWCEHQPLRVKTKVITASNSLIVVSSCEIFDGRDVNWKKALQDKKLADFCSMCGANPHPLQSFFDTFGVGTHGHPRAAQFAKSETAEEFKILLMFGNSSTGALVVPTGIP